MSTPVQGPWAKYGQDQGQAAGPWQKYGQTQQTPPSTPSTTPAQPSSVGSTFSDLVAGAGKGAAGGLDLLNRGIDKVLPQSMRTSPERLQQQQQFMQPHNATQEVGKGLENAAEFAVPIGGPEGKVARLGLEALRGGAVNKAQGGSFGAGAAMGGAGEGIAQGLKAVAPAWAESALNIRKTDRAYKPAGAIGKTILNDTRGVRPGTVAESAQGSLNQLNPQLDAAARAADVRPTPPISGRLQAPQYEVPLSHPQNSTSTQGGLFDAESRPAHGVTIISPAGRETMHPQYLSGGAHPEMSGRTAPPKGTLLTRDPDVARAGGANIPPPGTEVPYAGASLTPAKSVLRQAAGKATQQNEPTTYKQLQPMMQHLSQNRITGEPIGNTVGAHDLLNLKRGFGNEFIHNWNPETMTGVKGTAGQTYHQLGQEFNRVVPEAQGLNSKISNLIPVAKRGESAELNAPTSQRIASRMLAHTGALTGLVGGSAAGYQHGGAMGALIGGAAGLAGPEMMFSPTGQMITARALNSGAVRPLIRGAGGGLLQTMRGNRKDTEQ
jgi:hypothetical protein